jgi:hypothetical protein
LRRAARISRNTASLLVAIAQLNGRRCDSVTRSCDDR